MNFEGSGPQARVQVQFKQEGSKWLVLAYAKLEACPSCARLTKEMKKPICRCCRR